MGEICRLEDLKIRGSFVSYFNLIRIYLFIFNKKFGWNKPYKQFKKKSKKKILKI